MASGPWEDYQAPAQAAPAASGPWEDYAQADKQAPDTKSSVLQKVGEVLKTGGLAALKTVDWASHLFQPQAAKDLVKSIQTNPDLAPGPSTLQKKPYGFMDAMTAGAQGGLGGGGVPVSAVAGSDVRPEMAAVADAATSPMSYLGAISKIPGLGSVISKAGALPEQGITRLASELTGVSTPALKMASTGAGRTALEAASGQQGAIGKNLVEAVDNFESHIPEAKRVAQAVKNIGPVDLKPAIDALKKASPAAQYEGMEPAAILEHLSPDQRVVAGKIDGYVRFLQTHAASNPEGAPAEKALDLRRVLDSPIDFTTGTPNPKEVQGALFQARTALKNGLLASADKSGVPEYGNAMKTWADKLHILDDVKNAALGAGNDYSKQARATFFVNGLFGKGITAGQKQELVGKLDNVFGSDFLEQSKNARYAAEVGDGGKAAFLPVQHTGRAALGAMAGHFLGNAVGEGPVGAVLGGGLAALSSPAIATRLAIPASRLPPWLAAQAAKAALPASSIGTAAAQLPPSIQGAR